MATWSWAAAPLRRPDTPIEAAGFLPLLDFLPRYSKIEKKEGARFKPVYVLGSIAAGQPIDRLENKEEVIFIDSGIIRGREAFALKVKGDSMIGDHILDGDIVICAVQAEVTATDIAVVAVDGDNATLKRVKIQDEICLLIPSNPSMQPIIVPISEVSILGKVIEIRRVL